jgi:hypothetical protein
MQNWSVLAASALEVVCWVALYGRALLQLGNMPAQLACRAETCDGGRGPTYLVQLRPTVCWRSDAIM